MPIKEDTLNIWEIPKRNTRKTPKQEGDAQCWEDSQVQQDNDQQTQEETNGETSTEDTLKARVPHWVYKECKKIGVTKR